MRPAGPGHRNVHSVGTAQTLSARGLPQSEDLGTQDLQLASHWGTSPAIREADPACARGEKGAQPSCCIIGAPQLTGHPDNREHPKFQRYPPHSSAPSRPLKLFRRSPEIIEHLPPALLTIAQYPIFRSAGVPDGFAIGSVADAVLARRFVYTAVDHDGPPGRSPRSINPSFLASMLGRRRTKRNSFGPRTRVSQTSYLARTGTRSPLRLLVWMKSAKWKTSATTCRNSNCSLRPASRIGRGGTIDLLDLLRCFPFPFDRPTDLSRTCSATHSTSSVPSPLCSRPRSGACATPSERKAPLA